MSHIKQLKLLNGDEIVCEVVEYPDEDGVDLIIKNSYKIIPVFNSDNGTNFYSFRPWMIYQTEPNQHQILNIQHVIGEALPSQIVLDYYFQYISRDEDSSMRSAAEKLREYLETLAGAVSSPDSDSSSTNIIKFPPNKRLH